MMKGYSYYVTPSSGNGPGSSSRSIRERSLMPIQALRHMMQLAFCAESRLRFLVMRSPALKNENTLLEKL
jgi:hypothetical protein